MPGFQGQVHMASLSQALNLPLPLPFATEGSVFTGPRDGEMNNARSHCSAYRHSSILPAAASGAWTGTETSVQMATLKDRRALGSQRQKEKHQPGA